MQKTKNVDNPKMKNNSLNCFYELLYMIFTQRRKDFFLKKTRNVFVI